MSRRITFAIVSPLLTTALCACSVDVSGRASDASGTDAGPVQGDAAIDADLPDTSVPPDGSVPDGGMDAAVDAGPGDAGADGGADGGFDAGFDGGVDAGPPVDGGCTPAWNVCTGGVETVCDTATGSLVTRACPAGCRGTEPRCARVDPSNVDVVVSDPSAADVTVDTDVVWSTTSCNAAAGMVRVTALSGGVVCVLRTDAFTVSGTIVVQGDVPLVVLAEGPVLISGTIDVSAYGTSPGPGGSEGGDRGHPSGYGARAGLAGVHIDDYEDGGGGGAGACGMGGGGGIGDGATGGSGGGTHGSAWELEPLVGGSGGGLGPGASGSGYDNNGYGGAGGGALQITSQMSITLSGSLRAGGGGGDAGNRTSSGSINYGAGGGGGSGGSVLLEAPVIDLGSDGAIFATGGGGAGSASDGGDGTDGADGANSTGRASGGTRGGSRYGSHGGDSGGGATPDGLRGDDNTGWAGNGGGGGGGAGCILFRTGDGSMPSGATRSSPSTGLGLRALEIVRY